MIEITVATYNRPEKCLYTLQQVEGIGHVSVFRDYGDADYSEVERYCKERGYHYHVTDRHLGKWGYWRLHNLMYEYLETRQYEFYIQLPDDALLVENFTERAISLLADDLSCVGIFTRESNVKTFMSRKKPTRVVNGETIIQAGWLDCCIVTTKRVMDGFRVRQNWRSRRKNPLKASGVGREQATTYKRKTKRDACISYHCLVTDYNQFELDTVMHSDTYMKRHMKKPVNFSLKDEDREYIKAKYETQHRLSVQAQGHLGAEIQPQEP